MRSSVTISGADAKLALAQRQVPFAMAMALTALAQDGRAAAIASLPQRLDRPTPFTMQAVGIAPATKASLQSVVFVKDRQATYLAMQETGGTRTPAPGAPINLPVGQRPNQYGNIPKGAIRRAKARDDTFVANGQGTTAHLPPGLYKRAAKGRRRKAAKGSAGKAGGGLQLLVAFERQAKYTPRLGFVETVRAEVDRRTAERVREAVARALATAR